MKKILSLLLVTMLALSACSNDISPAEVATRHSETIMECLETGNTSKLEKLFCKSVSSKHDLHSEISGAIEFIDGNIIDEGRWIGLTAGDMEVRNGEKTKLNVHPILQEIKTDTGKEYMIMFTSYVIYDKNPDNIGMTYITIKNDEESYIIGEGVY